MTEKTDIDLDWPTFEKNDDYDRLSPDDEREHIFTEFKLATEDHKIRNKKRKPKKKRSLRLISESELFGKRGSWDRKKIIVVSVLVACVVIIVAVCIFLGVYFGAMNKSTSEGGGTAAAVEGETSSPQTTTPSTAKPTTTVRPVVVTTKPVTSPPTPKPTVPPTTTKRTTTTTTTTTATTTTTTPAPTTPPTISYTGSEEEQRLVLNTTINCREEIVITTDRLKDAEKCSLYYEMLRCVYIRLISDRLLVPVETLGQVAEDNSSTIFPVWITIEPKKCREESKKLDIRNMTSLPLTPSELCISPDAVMYYGKHVCQIIKNKDGLEFATEEQKCSVLWGVSGCVAGRLACIHDQMTAVLGHDALVQGLQLEAANRTRCNLLYDAMSEKSTCQPKLYSHMAHIYSQCARVLLSGSLIAANASCTLFESFFQCSYAQLPEVTRYEGACHAEKASLRQVAFDIAIAAAMVNYAVPFRNVTHCIDEPQQSTSICDSPDKLVAVIDSLCYVKFRLLSHGTICKFLSEYIYQCAPECSDALGLQCSVAQLRDAIVAQSDVILDKYGIDVKKKTEEANCVEPPP